MRRIYDRVIRTSLTQRALASIRWRSGLDADLDELRARLDRLEQAAMPSAEPVANPDLDLLPTRGSSKACATPADADLLEDILLALAARFTGDLSVLEWGSGLSTLHYPDWLTRRGVRVSWMTLEHDRDLFRRALEPALRAQGADIVWSEDLPRLADSSRSDHPTVTAVVFDKGPINPLVGPTPHADRAKDLDDYVALPGSLDARYHAVLVDGRKRRRCLLEAARLLEENGVVLLHDAQRTYYHSAFAAFRSGRRIGDDFWIGAQSDTDFADLVPEGALASPGLEYVPSA